jgi:hypothetical protein
MEENQNPQAEEVQEKPAFQEGGNGVSFPTVNQTPKSGGPKTILIAGVLILIAVLGFVIYKSATKNSEGTPEATPDGLVGTLEQPVAESTPSATSTPKASAREAVSIIIQNGTGITGEAAYLQTQLKNLGYSDIKVSNASSQDATTTTVTFSKDLASDIVTEITKKLNELYQKVTTSTSSSATTDVVIVTGLRKGATAKPSSTPAATSTGTPKPSSSPTASPTATP